jgi:hypothetical protein
MDNTLFTEMILPVSIPVNPWLFDHHFEGVAILPAVEMLQHMARAAQSHFPGATVTAMQHASFDRFLHIQPECTVIEACCSLIMEKRGCVSATLTTAAKLKNTAATRIKQHASVCFSAGAAPGIEPPPGPLDAFHITGFEISAHRLYSELVPFGPAFQSVQDRVMLTESAASARVYAADLPGASGPLGSPFPLDGSLHAACAWAQRYCGIVAFPIGFDERVLVQPITPGETIICSVIPVSQHEGVITFDIRLHDQEGGLREMVKGVAMRDVSGGRMTPPAWVRNGTPLRDLNGASGRSIP